MKTLNEILGRTIRAVSVLTAAILMLGAPVTGFAATSFLDQNAANPGLWDGATLSIGTDATTTTNWTLTAVGNTATTVFTTGNNIQIGASQSDFNGASIVFTNNFNGNIGGNPSTLAIFGTNTTVTFLGTTVNERFNHAITLSVSNTSVLNISGANYNYNNQNFTFVGNGTVNVSNVLGNNETSGGIIVNMNGGKMNLCQTSIGTYGNAATGHGFTLTNGLVNFVSPQSFADVFGDFQSGADQTVKFNGGTIDNLSGGPQTLKVNLGAYSIGASFTYAGSSQSMSLGTANVFISNSTPQITVGGNTFTIGGVISDNGNNFGITKAGPGTLALTGANTYAGPTTVNAGTLTANTTSTGNGSYTAGDNSTLDVQITAPGQSLHMSSLTLGSTTGATLAFDPGIVAIPSVAPINLGAGALTVNGSANPISFLSISAITNYPTVIPLIAYGTAGGNLSSLTLGAFPPSTPPFQGYISNDTVGQVIDLVLTNGLLTAPPGAPKPVSWTGLHNGNWDTLTFNWINGGIATNYANVTTNGPGDPATFDDTLTGTTNVILTQTLLPASVTFNNSSSNYVFTGSGKLSGVTGITETGSGSVVLDNTGNNDFIGGITVSSGTFQIGNNDANGAPSTGGITNNGILIFNRADSTLGSVVTISPITGSGTLINNGPGTLTLAGVQPYTGPTVVNAGTVALTGPNSNPSTLSATASITINNGGTVQFQADNVIGTSGPGVPVTINVGGVLTGLGTADGGVGTSSHLANMLTLNGGTLTMAGSQNNVGHGSWDLDGGVTVPGTNVTATISALTVIPSQGGGTVFNVTNGSTPSGIDLNVTGTFINGTSTHDTGIIKNGPGVMALDNNNLYAGNTTINGGTLQLGASGDSAVLASPLGVGASVTINSSSVLSFVSSKGVTVTNTIGDDSTGVVLSSKGTNTLTAANTYSGRTLVAAGVLALKSGGTINSSTLINVSNATFDISTGGTVSSSGAIFLTNSSFVMGTNTVGSIGTLGISNTTVSFPLIAGATPITVSGAFSTGGSTNVLALTSIPGFPVYPTNFALIKYGSFGNVDGANRLTTLGASLPPLGAPVGFLTNDTANLSIDFVLLSDTNTPIFPITWNGQTNSLNVSNWDILGTKDWVLSSDGITAYPYQDSSPVTFDDTAHGNGLVNLTTTVAPGSLTISNASKTYAFSGAGKITGAVALVKTNSGTATFTETGGDSFAGGIFMGGGSMTLSNANVNISGGITSFAGTLLDQHSGAISGGLAVNGGSVILDQVGTITGGTVINSGNVQVGNNDAFGTLPSGTLDDEGGLIFNRSDAALLVNTPISGAGGLTNNGTGSVTLTVTETNFTGPVVVNAGMLIMNAGNFATPNGISKASQLIINNNGAVGVLTDNSLSGHGGVNVLPIFVNAGGLLTGAPGANGGAGTSTHLTGLLTLNGGTLTNSGTSLNAANGSWDIDSGVAVPGGPVTAVIGCLDVLPTESGGTTFNVTNGTTPNGIDLDVTGTIIHGTSQPDNGIIKNGPGVMRMSNTNAYTSANNTSIGTTLNGGVLVANSPENPGVGGPLGATNAAQANLINFAGGTLRYSPVNQFDYSSRFGQSQPYSIDTAGQAVSFATAFIGGSSLTKIGNGTLSLTGANSYNGDTIAGGGNLITTTASTGAGNYTVTNGATLDVQVLGAGAQLTLASLTLGSNSTDTSTLQIDTLATGSPTAAPVNVTGGLVTNGTMNIALSGTALTAGTFPLISYAGTSASALFHFVPPVGFSGSLSDNNVGLISVTLNAVAVGPSTNVTITKVSLSGTNMIIHGTNNNVPNSSFHYAVLSATNLHTPLSNWVPVVTNPFVSGTFDYTNPIVPGTPRQFIDIEAVP